jgi:uncharacterized protein YgiM (DUF1202 family)
MARAIAAVVLLFVTAFVSAMLVYGLLTFSSDRLRVASVTQFNGGTIEPVYGAALPVAQADELDIARFVPVRPVAARQGEPASPGPAVTHTVSVDALRVRSGPQKNTPQLFVLKSGTQVSVIKQDRGWALVTAGGDRVGWVYGKLLSPGEQRQASIQ